MTRITTEALVVRAVEYGESDVIVTLITEATGKLGALVRGGRKSARRVGGALEPFHTIDASLEDRGGELAALREARLVRMRHGIVRDLEAIDAAGKALRWARHLFPARTREHEGWALLITFLDDLDAMGLAQAQAEIVSAPTDTSGAAPVSMRTSARAALARTGLRLLAAVGYALDFERCVGCGRPCPPGRPSGVDAARGGLVCRACGGGTRTLDAETRALALEWMGGRGAAADRERANDLLTQAQASLLLAVAEDAMAVHAGFEG